VGGLWLNFGGLNLDKSCGMMVARDGVEPPKPAFSGLYSLGLNHFPINLIRQGGHSFVTAL
jgi:hypothetical protein